MINNFISLFSLHLNQSSVYGTELTSFILSICLQWELPLPFHNCLHFSSPSLANIHLSIFISTRHFTCVLFLSCSAQHFVSYSILGHLYSFPINFLGMHQLQKKHLNTAQSRQVLKETVVHPNNHKQSPFV